MLTETTIITFYYIWIPFQLAISIASDLILMMLLPLH